MKFLKYSFTFLLSLVLLFISAAWIVSAFYEKEVKAYVIEQINSELNSKVMVADVNLTLIEKFPFAALKFKDVVICEPGSEKQLISASYVFLQFNILDIIRKNYTIRKIEINDGKANIRVYKNGKDNYHFWKASEDANDAGLDLNLKKVSINDISIVYNNEVLLQHLTADVKAMDFNGEFNSKHLSLNSSTNVYVRNFQIEKLNYLEDKELSLNVAFEAKGHQYHLSKGIIKIADLSLGLTGTIAESAGDEKDMDLKIAGKDLDIEALLSLLPDSSLIQAQNYRSEGSFIFNATVKGKISKEKNPAIIADFQIRKGKITAKKSDIALSNINLNGNFTNGKTRNISSNKLTIKDFRAVLDAGNVSGSFSVEDFKDPKISLNASAALNLSDILKLLSYNKLNVTAGTLNANVSYNGRLKSSDSYSYADYNNSHSNGKINIKDAAFNVAADNRKYEAVNAEFDINNNDLKVQNISGTMGNSDISFTGNLNNLLPYIFLNDEKLYVQGEVKSGYLDLYQILNNEGSLGNDTILNNKEQLIEYNLTTTISKATYKKFTAENITGQVIYANQRLSANAVNFKTMEGSTSLSAELNMKNRNEPSLILASKISNIQASQLFYQLEDFGQDVLQSKNIKGLVSADLALKANYNESMSLDPNSLHLSSDIKISNGELKNFEPLYDLSRFVELSELKELRFKTLQNHIEIKDKVITIPKMEIGSNALNVTFAGTHTFENIIDYHLKLSLNELLGQKAKKVKADNEEFGIIEDDGLGRFNLFISMKGNMSDPVIKYDRSGLKQKLEQDVLTEKQTLKSIFKDEFGWYKNDSTIKAKEKKKESSLAIEWEENNKPEPAAKNKGSEKSNKNRTNKLTKKAEKEELSTETSDDFN